MSKKENLINLTKEEVINFIDYAEIGGNDIIMFKNNQEGEIKEFEDIRELINENTIKKSWYIDNNKNHMQLRELWVITNTGEKYKLELL